MAESIIIDIIANFSDRASEKAEKLNASLNKLERASSRISSTATAGQKLSSGLLTSQSALEKVNSSLGTNINSLSTYKNNLKNAEINLESKKGVLQKTQQAYESNTQALQKNIHSLNLQKTSLESLISSRRGEIANLEHSNTIVNKGSKTYSDNQKAIQWIKMELDNLENQYKTVNSSILSNQNAMKGEAERYSRAKESVREASREYEIFKGNLKSVKRESAFGTATGILSGTKNTLSKISGIGRNIKDSIKSEITSVTDGIFSVKNMIMGAATGMMAQQTIMKPISYADQMTTASIGFETMLGSKSLAENMMNELQNFAAKTPFDTSGLISSSQQILRAGIASDAEGIIDVLTKVGNAASAAGQGTEGVEGIIYALQQMSMSGRVYSQDMMQLTNRGINAWKYVADGMGVSITAARKMSEDGLIPAGDAIQYILDGMKEYDGMMDKVSDKTAKGLMSNIKDTLQNKIELPWGQGLQKGATEGLRELSDWLETVEPQLESAGNTLRQFSRELSSGVVKGIKNLATFELNIINGESFKNASGIGDKIGVLLRKNVEGAFESHPIASSVISTWLIGKGASKLKNVGGGIVDFIGKDTIKSVGKKITTSFSKFAISKAGSAVVSGLTSSPLVPMAAIAVAGQAVLDITDKIQERSYLSSLKFTKDLEINQGALTEYANQWKELNDLKWERNDLTGKINSGQLGLEDVETAKQRLQEIDNLLMQEYGIDISCDSSELDMAIEKAQSLAELQMSQNVSQLLEGSEGNRETQTKLYSDTRILDKAKRDLKDSTQQRNQLQTLQNRYNAGTISESDYVYAARNLTGADIRDAGDVNSAITNYDNLIKNANEDITTYSDRVGTGNSEVNKFNAMAAETASSGISQYKEHRAAGLDTTYDLFNIDAAMQNSGLNRLSYARELAAAQSGVESFEKAVQNGGESLDQVTANTMENMKRWGASGVQIAEAGALTANGFKSIQDVINSGDMNALTNTENDINKFAESLNLIDSNKHIEISASGDLSVIDDVTGKMQEVKTAGGLSISVNAEGDISVLDQAGITVSELQDKGDVSLQVNASGNFDVIDNLGQKIAEIDKETGEIHEVNVQLQPNYEWTIDKGLEASIPMQEEITQEVSVNIQPKFGSFNNSFDDLPEFNIGPFTANTTADVSVDPEYKINKEPAFGPYSGSASASIAITANYSITNPNPGFSFSGGRLSVAQNATGGVVSKRLLSWVGEEGPEAIIPLIPARRQRGIDLWMQAGRSLGVLENAEGGIVGGMPTTYEGNSKIRNRNYGDVESSSSIEGIAGKNISIDIGGVTVSINVNGNSKNSIIDDIKAHSTEIAEMLTDEIERHISASFANSVGGGSE